MEAAIEIECSSPHNPTSNSSAEKGLGILKKLLAKSSKSGEEFAENFFALQNMPRTAEGMSPAKILFHHDMCIPLLPGFDDGRDKIACGFQHHYDRER